MHYHKVDYKSLTNKDKVLIALFNTVFLVISFTLNWPLLITTGCICQTYDFTASWKLKCLLILHIIYGIDTILRKLGVVLLVLTHTFRTCKLMITFQIFEDLRMHSIRSQQHQQFVRYKKIPIAVASVTRFQKQL